MKNNMFASLIEKPQATKKWLLFPLSIILHGLVVAAVVVVPLLSDNLTMPPTKILTVSLITAPEPAQVQMAAKAKKGKPEKPDAEKAKPKPLPSNVLMAPPTIPEDIVLEDDMDFGDVNGSEYGVKGGIENGDDLGILGGADILNRDKESLGENIMPSHVTPPRLIKKIKPDYPGVAIKAHIEGNVILEAVTDLKGSVSKVRVISGHPLLQSAAVQAVKQWIYEPYIINGYPKPVIFTVIVNFNLGR